jgi:DNA-directed RNA polymerase subunit RPC12/RpoP
MPTPPHPTILPDPDSEGGSTARLDDDVAEAFYEGSWSRLSCPHCQDMFEVESDVSNGEEVECDSCGKRSVVAGR